MTPPEIHRQLQIAFDALAPIFRNIEGDIRTDTAFAIGELTGMISKVKALVGRDIDDRWNPDTAPVHQVSDELREKIKRDLGGGGQ